MYTDIYPLVNITNYTFLCIVSYSFFLSTDKCDYFDYIFQALILPCMELHKKQLIQKRL